MVACVMLKMYNLLLNLNLVPNSVFLWVIQLAKNDTSSVTRKHKNSSLVVMPNFLKPYFLSLLPQFHHLIWSLTSTKPPNWPNVSSKRFTWLNEKPKNSMMSLLWCHFPQATILQTQDRKSQRQFLRALMPVVPHSHMQRQTVQVIPAQIPLQ